MLRCRSFARFCIFFRGIRVYFVKFINPFTGFGGAVLAQGCWDTDFGVFNLILVLVAFITSLFILYYLLYYFSLYPQDTSFKLGYI